MAAPTGPLAVGWVGTGVMGAPMAGHVLAAGHPLVVHTRTRSRADELLAAGATWADTPAEVAATSAVVCTIVGFPADVRAVVLGDHGVVGGLTPGAVLVDLTTSEPGLAEEIAVAARARGARALDAPVSGGDLGARAGRLSVMVGGDREALERARPVLDCFAATVVHQGGPGTGQHTKVVNQTLVAAGMVGVCEALLYAHRAGLDLDAVLATVSAGAAGSWALSNLAPRIVAGDLAPGFLVDHFVKDLGIALAEAERLRIALPGVGLARQLYVALQAQGGGRLGTQALSRALARLNAVDDFPPAPPSG